MKKAIILIILSIILFSACSKNNISSSNNRDNEIQGIQDNKNIKNQKYSFGPMADLSMIDAETKKGLQEFLNNLGDVPKDTITFNIMKAELMEDGSIAVDLFVRNGHTYDVFNIDTRLELIENNKVVATAQFEFAKDEFGVLPKDNSRPWTILYYPEDVKDNNFQIKDVTIKVDKYEYEF